MPGIATLPASDQHPSDSSRSDDHLHGLKRKLDRSSPVPKGPCRYMVYTWGPKGFPYTYFKAQVYTIDLHGPFGCGNLRDDEKEKAGEEQAASHGASEPDSGAGRVVSEYVDNDRL